MKKFSEIDFFAIAVVTTCVLVIIAWLALFVGDLYHSFYSTFFADNIYIRSR